MLSDNYNLRLSALVSNAQDIVLSHNSKYEPIKNCAAKGAAVKTIAEFTEIHLQVFRAGAMIRSVDKCFCIVDDPMQPFQQFRIRVKLLIDMIVLLGQRLSVAWKNICFNSRAGNNVLFHEPFH